MVGIRLFPFGSRPICGRELFVLGSVSVEQLPVDQGFLRYIRGSLYRYTMNILLGFMGDFFISRYTDPET